MKVQVLSAAVAGCLIGSLAWAQAPDLPKRKAGQWAMSVILSARPDKPIVMEQCIDGKTDATLQKTAAGMQEQAGCKTRFRKTAAGYESDATCKMNGSTVVSHSLTSGDFSSAYQVDVNATYTPPLSGMSQRHTTVKARYTGPCKPGMNAGDISMNGKKIGSVGPGGQAHPGAGQAR